MERPWEGKTILVVDDNEIQRAELIRVFEDVGLVAVGEAANGVEALQFIKERKPDMVSLDIIMPLMDGMECYQQLKKLKHKTMAFFVSALSSEHRVVECYAGDIGLERFLTKPLNAEELERRLSGFYGLSLPPAQGGTDSAKPAP